MFKIERTRKSFFDTFKKVQKSKIYTTIAVLLILLIILYIRSMFLYYKFLYQANSRIPYINYEYGEKIVFS